MNLQEINNRLEEVLKQAQSLPDDASLDEIKRYADELESLQQKREQLLKLQQAAEQVQREREVKHPAIASSSDPTPQLHTLADVARYLVQSDEFKRALADRTHRPYTVQGVTIPTPTYAYDRVQSQIQPPSQVAGTLVSVGTRTLAVTTFARETTTSYTGAAAPRNKGAAKAETNITYENVTSIAQSIAHIVKVNEEDLQDVQGLQQTIQQRGLAMLLAKEEDQILNGDGTAPNLLGILATTGVVTSTQGTDTLLDAVVKLIASVEGGGAQVSAIVVNPQTWATLITSKDTTGNYLGLLDVASGVSGTLAGYPLVRSPHVPANKVVVGDNRYATLWRVGGIAVASGYDSDDFSKNRVTIRIETRSALDVYRPNAFGVLALA